MNRFNSITVRLSWSLVLIAFSVLILGTGMLGLISNHSSRDAFGTLDRLNVEQAGALNRTYTSVLRARLEMDRAAELMRMPAFERPQPLIERARGLLSEAEQAFETFLGIPATAAQSTEIEALTERYRSLVNSNLDLQMQLLEEGDHAGYRSGQSRVGESSQAFALAADAFLDDSARQGEALTSRFERLADWMARAMLAALAVAALMVAGVMWGVTINVIRPLRRIVEHFQRIARGDLSQSVETRGSNEIGQLYTELATMQRELIETVRHLSSGSDGVYQGSRDMAGHNQSLAAQARQQAVALEQTAASLDQLTAAVASNADNARRVGESADAATQRAREGEEVITRFVATMEEIHGHSEEIATIIGLIESIAFQTNILALNASVEAARAGEQGRGFAVVANEVRALASRSGEAAREIRQRIQASHASVAEGNALSQRAAERTREFIEAIERVDALMGHIVRASDEQRLGIEEVNAAMAQIERATQDSSRLVEYAVDGAHELERQSLRMREQARRFALPLGAPRNAGDGQATVMSESARDEAKEGTVSDLLASPRMAQQRPAQRVLEPA
ncbi:methyl-accepting chemotaxis protein [Billgrantia saliphila]|uniref:methyl-accepting chemotaxis protein n=1 Tax=Billgrantia saliphila TaxID=1848458 RepID=UPI000CE305A5|nr:methyl-accepting chemotaxis protein [Halomonas saliphila]